jgi:hypothetical protein
LTIIGRCRLVQPRRAERIRPRDAPCREKHDHREQDDRERVAAQEVAERVQRAALVRQQQGRRPDAQWQRERAEEQRESDPGEIDQPRVGNGDDDQVLEGRREQRDDAQQPAHGAQRHEVEQALFGLGDAPEEEDRGPAERARRDAPDEPRQERDRPGDDEHRYAATCTGIAPGATGRPARSMAPSGTGSARVPPSAYAEASQRGTWRPGLRRGRSSAEVVLPKKGPGLRSPTRARHPGRGANRRQPPRGGQGHASELHAARE